MMQDPPEPQTVIEYPFPWPNEEKGFRLFAPEMEKDPLIFFHGTALENLEPIRKEGFKARPPLCSVSYAKTSDQALMYWCQKRDASPDQKPDGVVIVVRFETLETKGIAVNDIDIHVYLPEIQPTIIGYCIIPSHYVFG